MRETVVGDTAYDTDAVLGLIEKAGTHVESPSKPNRKTPRPFDHET